VENLWTALKLAAAITVMSMVIPLMIWGGSGSWRGALHAWASWAKIMGAMVLIFGGFGLMMAISEHGFPTIWRALAGG